MYFLWHEPILVLFLFIAGCSAFHEDEQYHEHCRQLPPRSRPWQPEIESQLWRGFETGWSKCSRRCSQNIQRAFPVGALPESSFLAIMIRQIRFPTQGVGSTLYCKLSALIFAALCTLANFELVTLWVRIEGTLSWKDIPNKNFGYCKVNSNTCQH